MSQQAQHQIIPASDHHKCQVEECPNLDLVSQIYDGVCLLLCRDHFNRLTKYVCQTQQHEDFLISVAAYRKAMSPFPQSGISGLSDADAIAENVRLEIIMRDIVNAWIAEPDATERDFYDSL